jgi:hypothetical protein
MAHGKRSEAVDILCKRRGDLTPDDPKIIAELRQLDAMVEATQQKRNNLVNIILGGRYSGKLHLGRRALMGFALQWIQQWTGILAIAAWAGTLFSLAGFDSYKSLWLAGLVNTLGVPGTAAASLVIDRIGRIKSLMISFITQGISLFLVAAFIKAAQDAAATDMDKSTQLGTAAASFVFVYLWYVTSVDETEFNKRHVLLTCIGSLPCSILFPAGSTEQKSGPRKFGPKGTASPSLAGHVDAA